MVGVKEVTPTNPRIDNCDSEIAHSAVHGVRALLEFGEWREMGVFGFVCDEMEFRGAESAGRGW